MASPAPSLMRRRAWVERARIGSLAERILEVDRLFVSHDGKGVLTGTEAQALRSIADRLGVVEP